MSWTTTTDWSKPGLLCTLVQVLFCFGSHELSLGAGSSLGCALSISSEGDVFVPVNPESVRATFDSQSAASGSNPKSQRKPQLKQPIFAQFLANATCFFTEGGGFPQISTRILSKVCKSLPNPSQTWAQIQKYSENRFFFRFSFFFFPSTFAAGSGQEKKEQRLRGKKEWGKRWCKDFQMSNMFCLSSGQKFGVAVNAQKMIHPPSPFHPPWLHCPLLIPETPSLYNLFYRVIQSCSATGCKYVITEPSSFARFTSKNRGTFEFTRAARTKKPRFLKQP